MVCKLDSGCVQKLPGKRSRANKFFAGIELVADNRVPDCRKM